MLRLQVPLPDRYTSAPPDQLRDWIASAKRDLGSKLLILGHHYQRDEVYEWADAHGDSFKLARFAADNEQATDIVFLGVHFMAESADVLTGDHQRVILPDLNAGCSMADMADVDQIEEAWTALADITDVEQLIPVTYMNSSAALKAFVGEHGGAVCTSSNARAVLEWALARGEKVMFLPDQHLGQNTAVQMGYDPAAMRIWNPHQDLGGLDERGVKEATFLLWRGWCSVHQRFRPEHVAGLPCRASRRPGDRSPRVRARRGGARGSRRLHGAHPGVGRGRRAGGRHRRRDRDPHGPAAGARASRAARSSPSTRWCARVRRCSGSTHLTSRGASRRLVRGEIVNQIKRGPANVGVGSSGAATDARHHLTRTAIGAQRGRRSVLSI